jgi:Ca-activated chloride channel family protein
MAPTPIHGSGQHSASIAGLLSADTAYLAVDSSRVTAGDEGTTVPVAVPEPEGVKYKTTVPGK